MEDEVLQGLHITESEWLELHGWCPWNNSNKCADLSRCAIHGGRKSAQMPQRANSSLSYGSRSTNLVTRASRPSSGTDIYHLGYSSHLKENLHMLNQPRVGKGKGPLSTLPSPWHDPVPTNLLPLSPGSSNNWQPLRISHNQTHYLAGDDFQTSNNTIPTLSGSSFFSDTQALTPQYWNSWPMLY